MCGRWGSGTAGDEIDQGGPAAVAGAFGDVAVVAFQMQDVEVVEGFAEQRLGVEVLDCRRPVTVWFRNCVQRLRGASTQQTCGLMAEILYWSVNSRMR